MADRPTEHDIVAAVLELPRVLSADTAAASGISRATLRTYVSRGIWRSIAPGLVLTSSAAPRRSDWLSAALIRGGPRAGISGWDALVLAGMPVDLAARRPLVLTRERDSRRVGPVLVRYTQRPFQTWRTSEFLDDLPFVPVVTGARAVADAVLFASRSHARATVTAAVQRRLCTADELVIELERGPRNGSAGLRLAIEDVLDGAASIAEAAAVDHLLGAPVPPFELNVPVIHRGVHVATVDELWRDLRAVLEIDSRRHHMVGRQWDRTLERHNRLTSLRLAVRHDPPSALGPAWAGQVADWLRDRADEIGVPYVADPRVIRPGPEGPQPLVIR